MAARRKSRRKKSRRSSGASFAYTAAAVVLFAAIVFLIFSLFDVFAVPPSKAEGLTVLVLNGCGVEGIGQRTAQHLRDLGLDVVDFRNADSFDYAESIVVDRTGDMASAVKVADLIDTRSVIQQIPETPLVDIIIIVGSDYGRYLSG